jgi:polygalacturonase
MKIFNIKDFGAIGDGKVNNAKAIQAAIDKCASEGGGRVEIDDGEYVSGSFYLRSNIELSINRGAVLRASSDPEDFDKKANGNSFIGVVEGADNILVTGGGVIDGNSDNYIESQTPYIYKMKRGRPFVVYMIGGTNLTFRDITIKDGAVWTVRLVGCRDVLIDGIRILNDLKTPNSDGIDIDHCQNVRIVNCHLECGDDCIVMKAMPGYERFGTCENIVISNCTMTSTSFAINIGCETKNPMRNMVISNCVIYSSHRGIGIHLSHECDIENIIFSDIVINTRVFDRGWWGMAEPIYVVALPWEETDSVGKVRRIKFKNILCRGENGVFVYGNDKNTIENITFDNVDVVIEKTSKWDVGMHDLRPYCKQPEIYEHDNSGFYIYNASNVSLKDCRVSFAENLPEYYSHALEVHSVDNLRVENFSGEAAHSGIEAICID